MPTLRRPKSTKSSARPEPANSSSTASSRTRPTKGRTFREGTPGVYGFVLYVQVYCGSAPGPASEGPRGRMPVSLGGGPTGAPAGIRRRRRRLADPPAGRPMTAPSETPSWLLALGKEPPPPGIELEGRTYELERVFKHDFFAYTALYRGATARIVLKIGRRASFFGFPLGWIGRLHAWHESTVFREVEDLDVVPRFTGRYARDGITHEFVAGHQLERGEKVPDDFFRQVAGGARGDPPARNGVRRPGEVRERARRRRRAPLSVRLPDLLALAGPLRGAACGRSLGCGAACSSRTATHLAKLQRRTRPDQMTRASRSQNRGGGRCTS